VLVVSRRPVLVAVMASFAGIVLGTVVLSLRRRVQVGSLGGSLLLVSTALAAATVVAAVGAYPQVEPATLGSPTGTTWKTTLPVDRVWGMRSRTDRTITIEGTANHRGCTFDRESVTLDVSTGEILEVTSLPTSFVDASQVPAALAPIPFEFEVIQGSMPFICRS
jgi:hypothetical protein